MAEPNTELTPMLRQYFDIKQKYDDAFLFFRLGDFYEMFFEDALKAAPILNVTLTSRGNYKGKEIPMCGVPYHAVDSYLSRMIKANQKVAICEQVEDPKMATGVVKRKVVRVVTPGTVIDDSLLESKKNNYLGCLTKTGANFGFAYAELSTGEFKVAEVKTLAEIEREISRIKPSELIIPKYMEETLVFSDFYKRNRHTCLFEADWIFEHRHAFGLLTEHLKTHSLDGFGLDDSIPGVSAAGGIVYYIREKCPNALLHMKTIRRYDLNDFMSLDEATKRNLELLDTPNNPKGVTLIQVLDHTKTAMGARLFRSWIHSPLRDLASINRRQEAVTEFKNDYQKLLEIQSTLKEMGDVERITGRVACGNANPRDLLALKKSLTLFPVLGGQVSSLKSVLFSEMAPFLKDFSEVTSLIEKGIAPEAPLSLREGGVIREGFDASLDEIRDISKNAKEKISQIQQREAEKTGIKNLKIKFNNVFGYYFEVSKGNVSLVPDYFIRKQTLVNGERYITEELKELEGKILGAEQKSLSLEQKLFGDLREKVALFAEEIKISTFQVSVLDVIASFAEASSKYDYVRPEVSDSDRLSIHEARHPVVERLLEPGSFISNDTLLDCGSNQIMIITGPNMAGKSTYIRQVALIVLLAQVGCHVPAKSAEVGIVDRIFTRVGAYDDLSGGKSTFMVEMNETANILNNATSKSLIILDEIGRGTSTFDGISIAWAVIEFLHYQANVKAKTLFATHFHELTCLEDTLSGVKNLNISVKEWNDEILFLRKIVTGAADKSYGIHVARLAGLPGDLISRAKEILCRLEQGGIREIGKDGDKPNLKARGSQLELFGGGVVERIPESWQRFLEECKSQDPLRMTPIEALTRLNEIVEQAKKLKS